MSEIAYEDFAKLELRVAEIVSVEEVEDSDKLYKISLRVGEEERTIVSGIRQHYSKEQLLGKKIMVIVNLLPRMIKGIESNGMLLAATDPENKKIVIAELPEAESGWKVR